MQYQGKTVNSRPAKAGDPGFDAAKDQVVITFSDGTAEKTVLRTETTN